MADLKITDLTAAGALSDTDLLEISQGIGGTPVSRKVSWSSIKSALKTYFDGIYQAAGSYLTASSTDTLTNKTFDANGTGNSLSNVDVADLADGTDGQLITWDADGKPATVAVGTAGHVLTSNGAGAPPTFQAGGGGSMTWTEVTGTSDDLVAGQGFIANNNALVTLTLPTTAAVGTVIEVVGKGEGLWKIAQNASQTIHFGVVDSTTGTGGSLSAMQKYDAVRLVCITADTDWSVVSSQGYPFVIV